MTLIKLSEDTLYNSIITFLIHLTPIQYFSKIYPTHSMWQTRSRIFCGSISGTVHAEPEQPDMGSIPS